MLLLSAEGISSSKEPKSWEGEVGRCSMQPVRDSKRPMLSVLRDLEAGPGPAFTGMRIRKRNRDGPLSEMGCTGMWKIWEVTFREIQSSIQSLEPTLINFVCFYF